MSFIGSSWKDDDDSYDGNMTFRHWSESAENPSYQESSKELKELTPQELVNHINKLERKDREFVKRNIR